MNSIDVYISTEQSDPYIQSHYVNVPLEMKIVYKNDSVEYRMLHISNRDSSFVIVPPMRIKQFSFNNGPTLRTLVEIHTETIGVRDISDLSSNIIAYPNPANNYVRLLLKDIFAKAEIKIFNILCEEVKVQSIETEKNNEMKLIDVSELPNGVYFITVYSGKITDTIRITVQH
ncbi:MAG: T9SS type A sorting domain-containing protein [Ignavibacteriae bacterium]|nr:T9SS type A sorting domain-containing protein [Ignavibacteriota bacterium]